MTYTIDSAGWFSEIGGQTIHRRDLTKTLPGTAMPWTFAKPVGILWHYTDGYNADISGAMTGEGFITAQMSIGRSGSIYQYADIFTAHWHAYAASQWGVGVEHEAHPPDSNLTDVQLGVSAVVFAAIIDAVKHKFHNDIPLVHVTGCDLGHPGLKEHADGLGCSWDPKGHSDKLYGWGWPKYLAAVQAALPQEDDMTDDEKKQLHEALIGARRFEAMVEGQKLARAGKPLPDPSANEPDVISKARSEGWQNTTAALNNPVAGGGSPTKPFDATITPK